MEESDEQLMAAVKNDELDRLNELCHRYQERLYNYFLKSTLDAADSSDLTQNVFIRSMKYRRSYREGSNFEIWIFQIARNLLKDHFRKMKIYRDRFNPVEIIPDIGDHVDEEQREREEKLLRVMKKLPEEKRELLVLSKFEGMKYEKIAVLKNMSVAAIKVQIHRTVKQLKELYFEESTI